MSYAATIKSLEQDPEQLELAYRHAVEAGDEANFAAAVETSYAEAQGNLLLAAWHYRLAVAAARVKARVIAWRWALPLAVLNGLVLWLLSDEQQFSLRFTSPLTGQTYTLLPAVFLLAVPVSAALIAAFLALAGKGRRLPAVALAAVLAAATAYVLLLFPRILPQPYQQQYLSLMVLHLGILGWAAIGFVALAGESDEANRFAFLVKSLEVVIVAGLLAIAGGIFTAITFGLFSALDIELPAVVQRLFIAGGGGLIVVVAVALVYDPTATPLRQAFDEGLSKLVALLLRLMLPLSVGVLLVYLAFIPFNWQQPFENRDVLVIFNAMLFAVIALLVGALPVRGTDLSERGQTWLRRGAVALAVPALLISLYALAAIVYRTTTDRMTPNRLLFIGWNVVNIFVLAYLLLGQARAGRAGWLRAMHSTFSTGLTLYLIWAIAGLLILPWRFAGDPARAVGLPHSIQQIVYEKADPLLLKCPGSLHIYLLQGGQKRWVKDIPTFEAQGYRWSDVNQYVPCDDLRAVPDGETIPPGSGPAPQP
jgi:hypothetical protein